MFGMTKGEKKLIDASNRIEKAVAKVLKEGKTLTQDLGGNARCSEVGDAITAKITELG